MRFKWQNYCAYLENVATYSTICYSIKLMRKTAISEYQNMLSTKKPQQSVYQYPDHENKRRECGASICVDLSTYKIDLYLVTVTGTSLMSTLASSLFASAGS